MNGAKRAGLTSFRLPEWMVDAIDRIVAAEEKDGREMTRSGVIRAAVRHHLKAQGYTEPKKKGKG